MAFEVVYDALPDTVEESERQFFEEVDGKHRFNLKKYEEHVKSGLVAKNKELVDRLGKVKPIAEKFKDVTDEEWTEFQEYRTGRNGNDEDGEDSDKDKSKKEGKPDPKLIQSAIREEKKKWDAAAQVEIKKRDEQITAWEQKYDNKLLEDGLLRLADEHGVIPKRRAAWLKQVRDQFSLQEGEIVFLEGGQPSGKYDAEAAVRDVLFKQYDYLYEPREAGPGSGTRKAGAAKDGAGKTIKRSDFDKLSQPEKDKKIAEKVQIVD